KEVTMKRSCRKTLQNVFKVINTLTFSTLIRLVALAITALLLVNYARFTPREVIELIHTIMT
ncbi:MAG TPA: hypothetical protein VEG39_18200, partial [Clostridia bacterium]|nr:hypothetical protein [Clostridia bacterium]